FDSTNNGRLVIRHSVLNHSGIGSHGAESATYGTNHLEAYNNKFVYNGYSDRTTLNVNWWFLIRGGTFAITDNSFQCCQGTDYPGRPGLALANYNLRQSNITNACWGAGTTGGAMWPVPRQVGRAYVDGSAGNDASGIPKGELVPGYLWNNAGNSIPVG